MIFEGWLVLSGGSGFRGGCSSSGSPLVLAVSGRWWGVAPIRLSGVSKVDGVAATIHTSVAEHNQM